MNIATLILLECGTERDDIIMTKNVVNFFLLFLSSTSDFHYTKEKKRLSQIRDQRLCQNVFVYVKYIFMSKSIHF